jgi:para-aminobenzoate synthetase/4-amino-4-deoxychorismate lyase
MNTNFPVFFESILYHKGQFPFLQLHLDRIQELALYLQVKFESTHVEFEKLLRAVLKEDTEQKLRVKLKLNKNKLEVTSIESELIYPYTFNQYPAIDLEIYPHYCKPQNGHSLWKYENPFIYQDSMEYAREKGKAQAILLNEKGNIAETSLSNFFYFIDDKLYTPPLGSGAVNGVFRRYIMSKTNVEERDLHSTQLNKVQECFVTSAVRGIICVSDIDGYRYSTQKVKKVKDELYTMLTKDFQCFSS